MKFSTYQPQVNLGTINGGGYRPVGNKDSYGNGEGMEAMASALGQVNKVATKIQDQNDAADVMDARNKIMTSLTNGLYGENGLFTTAQGENAKGLTDRVTELIRQTSSDVASNYNGRVQKALQGNLNENMQNFQRIAASKEMQEKQAYDKQVFNSSIDNAADLASKSYNINGAPTLQLKNMATLVEARAMQLGMPGQAKQQLMRDITDKIIGGAAKTAIENEDYQRAGQMLESYRGTMNADTYNQLYKVVHKQQQKLDDDKTFNDIVSRHRNADGTIDRAGVLAEFNSLHGEGATKAVAGNKSNARLWNIAQMVSAKNHINPDFVYGVMMHESGRGEDLVALANNNFAGLHGGAAGRHYGSDEEFAEDLAATLDDDVYRNAKTATDFVNHMKENGYFEDDNVAGYIKDVDYFGNEDKNGGNANLNIGDYTTSNSDVDASTLTPLTQQKIALLARDYENKYGEKLNLTSATEGQHDTDSYHYSGQAVDIAQDSLADADKRHWLIERGKQYGLTPLDEYENKSDNWTGEHVHFSDHGEALPNNGGGTVSAYDPDWISKMTNKVDALIADETRQKKQQEAEAQQNMKDNIVSAGSYTEAIDLIDNSGFRPSDKQSFYNYAKSVYHISASNGSSSSGGSSRSSSGGVSNAKITAANNTIEDFAGLMESKGEFTYKQLNNAKRARDLLYYSDNLSDDERNTIDTLANDEDFMSRLTDDINNNGTKTAFDNLVQNCGGDSRLAAMIMSFANVKYAKGGFDTDNDEES